MTGSMIPDSRSDSSSFVTSSFRARGIRRRGCTTGSTSVFTRGLCVKAVRQPSPVNSTGHFCCHVVVTWWMAEPLLSCRVKPKPVNRSRPSRLAPRLAMWNGKAVYVLRSVVHWYLEDAYDLYCRTAISTQSSGGLLQWQVSKKLFVGAEVEKRRSRTCIQQQRKAHIS